MKNSTYEVFIDEVLGEVIHKTDIDGKVWSIPSNPANSDYQEYLASLEAPKTEAE
jgi:hypothetical protein